MKKLDLILATAVLLLCFAVSANAQNKFGAKGVLNFNDYQTKSISLKNKTGWQAGVMARFNLPIMGIGIQPEALYTQKLIKAENEPTLPNETTRTSHLQVPINVIWSFGSSDVKAFILGGPYFCYTVDLDKSLKNAFEKFDWGLGLGAGLDIGNIHAGIRYDWGIQNVAKNSNDIEIKNKAFSIFIGYFF